MSRDRTPRPPGSLRLGTGEQVRAERLRIHDRRHTAASLAIKSGANVKVVQNMLGHKSAQMTLDRYAGLFESDQVDVARRMDQMMAEPACHENATKTPRIILGQVIPKPKPPAKKGKDLVAPAGFEPATHGLGNRRSIP